MTQTTIPDPTTLARLMTEQAEHAQRLRLLGYAREEMAEHPVYAERAGHIARLQDVAFAEKRMQRTGPLSVQKEAWL